MDFPGEEVVTLAEADCPQGSGGEGRGYRTERMVEAMEAPEEEGAGGIERKRALLARDGGGLEGLRTRYKTSH